MPRKAVCHSNKERVYHNNASFKARGHGETEAVTHGDRAKPLRQECASGSVLLETGAAVNKRLTRAAVRKLCSHRTEPHPVQLPLEVEREVQQVLESTAAHAISANKDVAEFAKSLQTRARQIGGGNNAEAVQRVVADMLTDTDRMRASAGAFSEILVMRIRELNELGARLKRAESDALLDPLTGLNNRRGFERAVHDITDRDNGFARTSLLIIDVDHFKLINDSFGHLRGDKVLCNVAKLLRTNTKGGDVAVRLGGDEFAVLLPATAVSGAVCLAEKLRAAVARRRIRDSERTPHTGQVTISVGVAGGEAGDTLEDLMERADKALYAAKRSGRNRVGLPSMQAKCSARTQLA